MFFEMRMRCRLPVLGVAMPIMNLVSVLSHQCYAAFDAHHVCDECAVVSIFSCKDYGLCDPFRGLDPNCECGGTQMKISVL